jgi:hypothetical protein
MKYRSAIMEEQMILRRLADVAIHLFSMSAVTSRASRSLKLNLPSAAEERQMCNCHCEMASRQIANILRELEGKNEDKEAAEIADIVFEKGGYHVSSPIGLNE